MIQSINSAVLKGSVNVQLAISGLMKRPPHPSYRRYRRPGRGNLCSRR